MSGKDKKKKKEEPSSMFQRHRVDILLGELTKKFPPKGPAGNIVAAQGPQPVGPPVAPTNPPEKTGIPSSFSAVIALNIKRFVNSFENTEL